MCRQNTAPMNVKFFELKNVGAQKRVVVHEQFTNVRELSDAYKFFLMVSFVHGHISSWTARLRLFIGKNNQTANSEKKTKKKH